MPKELAKQYAPQGTEDRIYQNWCDKGYFHTQIDRSKKPFTIVMPPPKRLPIPAAMITNAVSFIILLLDF